ICGLRGFSFPLEAMEVTGKSKTGDAGRKVLIARADARASLLGAIVAELRRGGIASWYGIAGELNKRGIPTATGRGTWEPGQVRRVMERVERRGPNSHQGSFARWSGPAGATDMPNLFTLMSIGPDHPIGASSATSFGATMKAVPAALR